MQSYSCKLPQCTNKKERLKYLGLYLLQGMITTLLNLILKLCLKGEGHVTVNKPVISVIYIVAPFCSAQILVDGVKEQ